MRTTLTALAVAAIPGVSFVVGQASAPEPAESAQSNRAVVSQLKKLNKRMSSLSSNTTTAIERLESIRVQATNIWPTAGEA